MVYSFKRYNFNYQVLLISVVFALIFKRMADESVPPKVDFEKLQTISKSQFKAKSREGFNGMFSTHYVLT